MTKHQLLIGLDTAIGCIIWTAPDYSSPERQRPFIVEWQQTSHGPLQPAELRARPACHNPDYGIGQIMNIYKIPMLLAMTATAVMTEAVLTVL